MIHARARCWIHEDCLVDLELAVACGPNPQDMQVLDGDWADGDMGGNGYGCGFIDGYGDGDGYGGGWGDGGPGDGYGWSFGYSSSNGGGAVHGGQQ